MDRDTPRDADQGRLARSRTRGSSCSIGHTGWDGEIPREDPPSTCRPVRLVFGGQ